MNRPVGPLNYDASNQAQCSRIFPENLLDWLSMDDLVALVLEVVSATQSVERISPFPEKARAATAIVTFCYARGILGSCDIAAILQKDQRVVAMFDWDCADWHWIRRHRRDHANWIRLALAGLFRAAWEWKFRNGSKPIAAFQNESGRGDVLGVCAASACCFQREATARLRQALRSDSIALDD